MSLNYRKIITIKLVKLYKKPNFFIKSLKSKKKNLALTLFFYVSREIWLGNSKKLICTDQSRFYIFSHTHENSKMFNVTSKYFCFFINKPPACWVTHITRGFITCYSCSYYSSILKIEILRQLGQGFPWHSDNYKV